MSLSETYTAQQVIEKLGLVPLPEEGGYYRLFYKDPAIVKREALGEHGGDRHYSTSIYYLVTPEEFSGLHAVKSTELFHFYAGDPVEMLQINSSGELKQFVLGPDIFKGQSPQVSVDPYVWQGTRLLPGGKWALLGCTVAPGFEFEDFLIHTRDEFIEMFPQHIEVITPFTRESLR